jgi:hypothetical protein
MKFRFAEEEDSCGLVTRLASSMGWVEPQHLLKAEYMHEQWQPEKVGCLQLNLLGVGLCAAEFPACEAVTGWVPCVWLVLGSVVACEWPLPELWPQMDSVLSHCVLAAYYTLLSTRPLSCALCSCLQVAELLQCMQPGSSSFRIDLLTKSYAAIKQQLQEAAADPSSWLGSSSNSSNSGSGVQGFTEPWFKLDALSVKLPDSLTGSWAESAVADDLALPPPNPYIPSDFELKTDGSTAAAAAAADSKQLLAAVAPWMLVGGAAAKPDMLLAAPPAMLLDEPGRQLLCFRKQPSSSISTAAEVLLAYTGDRTGRQQEAMYKQQSNGLPYNPDACATTASSFLQVCGCGTSWPLPTSSRACAPTSGYPGLLLLPAPLLLCWVRCGCGWWRRPWLRTPTWQVGGQE